MGMKLVGKILVAGGIWFFPLALAVSDDLKASLAAFDHWDGARDDGAMRGWVRSEKGKSDLAILLKHYPELKQQRQQEISMELARLGVKEVVPLVKASFAHPAKEGVGAMPGIFYAVNFVKCEAGFRAGLAPLVANLLEDGAQKDRNYALQFLPTLDLKLANQLLGDPQQSTRKGELHLILKGYEGARASPSPVLVEAALKKGGQWKEGDVSRRYHWERLYGSALTALARKDDKRALALVEEAVNQGFRDLSHLARVSLTAAGIDDLYQQVAGTPVKQFSEVPKPARLFFAVSYFESQLMNGGYDQAVWNSSGDYLEEIQEGYRLIEAGRRLRILKEVMSYFGKEGPSRSQSKRRAQMDRLGFDLNEKLESFEDPKSDAGKAKGKAPKNVEFLIAKYAAAHAAEMQEWLAKSRSR